MSVTILQINSVVNFGSTGRIAEEIGYYIENEGWKSIIAYGREKKTKSISKLIKIGNESDVLKHVLLTRLTDRHGQGSKKSTNKFIKQIQEIKPDLIHLHNIHGYYVNYEVLFNYMKSSYIPVVWTLHDCWPITGHCVHFEDINCAKWKEVCTQCPQTRTYPESLLIDNSKNNFKSKQKYFTSLSNLTIVPVSQWLENVLTESFLKDQNIETIHNGVNTSVFYPKNTATIKKRYNLKGKFVILGVANIWGQSKGLHDFIKLSKMLFDDEIIIMVGLNQKQIKTLPTNIIGIERTENIEQLADFYSISDVFLNLTYADTFPTTNIEALACGTPIITYKTGGSVEAVNQDTGFVIPQSDFKQLKEKIGVVKNIGKNKYSKFCIDRVRRNFEKEKQFLKYINLYKRKLH